MIIPAVDPMPLPAPVWLLRTLLLLTFGLHLLFMNVLFGGTLTALVCSLRRRASENAARLARDLGRMLPVVFAFTITLGVAPLLFLQVLYGNLLYASSILIAVPWLSVIALVLLAYYAVYYFSFRAAKNPRSANFVLALAVLLLAAVAHVNSNNFTLMLTPARWLALYGSGGGGWHLNWAEPTLLARYLHFLLAALAITGLFLVVLGLRKRESAYGRWLIQEGARLFVAPTALNYLVGIWFLVKLPEPVKMALMGRDPLAALLLGVGFLLPLAAVAHLLFVAEGRSLKRNALIGVLAGVATVAVMVVLRDVVRNQYRAAEFRLDQLPVAPQWSVIALFLLTFIAGLVVLAWMLRAVMVSRPADSSASAAATRS